MFASIYAKLLKFQMKMQLFAYVDFMLQVTSDHDSVYQQQHQQT